MDKHGFIGYFLWSWGPKYEQQTKIKSKQTQLQKQTFCSKFTFNLLRKTKRNILELWILYAFLVTECFKKQSNQYLAVSFSLYKIDNLV